MAEKRYLKNAWAKKDADGVYWLFIEAGGLQSMFCLYRPAVDPISGQLQQYCILLDVVV